MRKSLLALRRHRRLGWVALTVLILLAAVAGWKLGWLPIRFMAAETGRLLPRADQQPNAASREPKNGKPRVLETHSPAPAARSSADSDESAGQPSRQDESKVDPAVFTNQSEPPVQVDHRKSQESRVQSPQRRAENRDRNGKRGPESQIDNSTSEIGPPQPASRPAGEQSEQVVQAATETEDDVKPKPPLEQIDRLLKAGDYLDAHRQMSVWYWKKPQWREAIRGRLEKTARSIYFDPQPHCHEPYVVQAGDRLGSIAKEYDVSWRYLAEINRTDPRRIRPGQKLKVTQGPFSALIDTGDFTLTVHLRGHFVAEYPVGIGQEGTTPLGTFKVLKKLINPTYYGPEGEVIDADDPQNPLGERWIDLGDGYGIHGTIDPDSIGGMKSRGCIRMHNEDVAEVYNLLTVGSQVVIRR